MAAAAAAMQQQQHQHQHQQQLLNGGVKKKATEQSSSSSRIAAQQQFMLASLGLNVLLIFAFALQRRAWDDESRHKVPAQLPLHSNSVCPHAYGGLDKLPWISSTSSSSSHDPRRDHNSSSPVNLDHGDPTMFEAYWLGNGDSCTTVILGWEQMSYFASQKQFFWFVEADLEKQIRELHALVKNAVTEGKHIVVGTGSTQLFQAALYAVSTQDETSQLPTSVVSAVPYYSSYPVLTDYLKSGIHKWAGDASKLRVEHEENGYIELVTCPNNPDGSVRHSVVNGSGSVIYDLAYYWPHYTPITSAANHDIMLFTASKSTGHAGTRIGWAIVKDHAVAQKMAKFIELNTIGVSHDSQLRAAQILRSIVNGYKQRSRPFKVDKGKDYLKQGQLFHFGYTEMQRRWDRLREVVGSSDRFSLPTFVPTFCNFFGQVTATYPAFAWLRCNRDDDCRELLSSRGGILSRSGSHFGAGTEYVRISMLDRHHNFQRFVARLLALAKEST